MSAKRGPKPQPPEKVRGVVISAWLTPSEAEVLTKAAEELGISQSSFIRDALAEKVLRQRAKRGRPGLPSVNYK